MLEPHVVTDQFGIALNAAELEDSEFRDTLRIYVEIAVEAVTQASKRRSRDWRRYEELVS
jgi:hypothetical protein